MYCFYATRKFTIAYTKARYSVTVQSNSNLYTIYVQCLLEYRPSIYV
jgi:hypothetical protein